MYNSIAQIEAELYALQNPKDTRPLVQRVRYGMHVDEVANPADAIRKREAFLTIIANCGGDVYLARHLYSKQLQEVV